MTKSLHEISRELKDALELNDGPEIFLSNKVNLVYLLNAFPDYQTAITNMVAITQNTWYDVFSTWGGLQDPIQSNVRVYAIQFIQDTANEDLVCELTINGTVYTATQTAVAATPYSIAWTNDPTVTTMIRFSTTNMEGRSSFLDCKSLRIRVRKTSAAGANHTHFKLIWAKW